MKTKLSFFSDEDTDVHTRKILGAGSNCICWSAVLIYSVLRKDEQYYPQVFFEKCKYIEKKKVIRSITDDSKFSSDKSDESDEE